MARTKHFEKQHRDGDGRRFTRELSAVDERQIVVWRNQRYSCQEIADALGVSAQTVSRYARRNGVRHGQSGTLPPLPKKESHGPDVPATNERTP